MSAMNITISEVEETCGVTDSQVKDALSKSRIAEDYVMLPTEVSPAVSNAAARSVLGEGFHFSHLALGLYPVYRKA